MLGAADDRHVWARPHSLDQAKGRPTAPDRRGEIENAALDVLRDRLGRRPASVGTPTDERKIAAGAEEPAGRAGHAPGVDDGTHLEIVAQDEAREAEPSPQKAVDDFGRERGGQVTVEGGKSNMGDENGRAAGAERRPERYQLAALEVVQARIDVRQLVMRIDGRATVPREVLGHGQEPSDQHGPNGGNAARRDRVRIGRESAIADHRAR